MANENKRRGRPPLTDEQREERRIMANQKQAERHKRNGYAAQKKYHASNDPRKEQEWRKISKERQRGKYYQPTLRIQKKFQDTISELSLQTGLSINQLFLAAFEEKYHILLHDND